MPETKEIMRVRSIVERESELGSCSEFAVTFKTALTLEEAARILSSHYAAFTNSKVKLRGPFKRDSEAKICPNNPFYFLERKNSNPDMEIEPAYLAREKEISDYSITCSPACEDFEGFHDILSGLVLPPE